MQRFKAWAQDRGATLTLSLILGMVLMAQHYSTDALSAANERIKKLEGDVRTYSGKYLDLQEARNEELEAAQQGHAMEMYAAKNALEACQAKGVSK
jgi:hypothetical protein